MGEAIELTTPLGARVRVASVQDVAPHFDPGVMVELSMVDPADCRRAEVYLPTEQAGRLASTLLLQLPCVEGREHDYRQVGDPVQLYTGLRNSVDFGAQPYSGWRVVEVCWWCGNPRVHDVERKGREW